MTLRLPIGFDNFADIIARKLDFVDKSLFIKALFDDATVQVVVITRPRRFGKTLNLSMLHYFLAAEVYGQHTKGMFDSLKIAAYGEDYMRHQGRYPVIFITLKDVNDHCFENAFANLRELMAEVYREHESFILNSNLETAEKEYFKLILGRKGDEAAVRSALFNLCYYLFHLTGVKPWLLIDEYDSPILSAFLHGYYEQMTAFMRGMFGKVLKSNPYLGRCVITGILRVSKESLFSGLNNVKVYTLLNSQYGEFFGFTEEEVQSVLNQAGLKHDSATIRNWYNGYQAGSIVLYNPWSIANCIHENGELAPYWANTSGNDLIRKILTQSMGNFKVQFERLLAGHPIEELIDEQMVFADLEKNETAVWSLLFAAGYLKVINSRYTAAGLSCTLTIPNQEVSSLYLQIIARWLSSAHGIKWYLAFINHLLTGNLTEFQQGLKQIMESVVSSHDLARDPEVFYHGLVIGLTASLFKNPDYEIRSNRESGYGRYDYLILSRDKTKLSLLLEFKRVDYNKDSAELARQLDNAAKEALTQILQKKYCIDAEQSGSKILRIGIAFSGKHFKLHAS